MVKVSLFLILIYLASVSSWDPAYCKLNDNHVLCISPNIGPNCKARTPWFIDDRLRIEILHLHNSWRQNVALESETRGREGTQPPATNMMKMRWDYELTIIAQTKAHQCLFQHDCEGCNAVVDGRFKVGQNLALFRTLNRDKVSKMDFLRLMKNWYEHEVSYVTRSSVENYRKYLISNYGQIIAWNARAIGCGASQYLDGIYTNLLIVCNYGNRVEEGTQLYRIGTPCSECPDETKCDSTYFGLCALKNQKFKVESRFEPADGKYIPGIRRPSPLNQG